MFTAFLQRSARHQTDESSARSSQLPFRVRPAQPETPASSNPPFRMRNRPPPGSPPTASAHPPIQFIISRSNHRRYTSSSPDFGTERFGEWPRIWYRRGEDQPYCGFKAGLRGSWFGNLPGCPPSREAPGTKGRSTPRRISRLTRRTQTRNHHTHGTSPPCTPPRRPPPPCLRRLATSA